MLRPGNIWSGSKTLAAFTNPTCLAYQRGNLDRLYSLYYRYSYYKDAEEAYQKLKHLYTSDNRIFLMTNILIEKFKQYPELFEAIKYNGGVKFLEKCDHIVYGKSTWEGKGRESKFIRCLIAAYNNVH